MMFKRGVMKSSGLVLLKRCKGLVSSADVEVVYTFKQTNKPSDFLPEIVI